MNDKDRYYNSELTFISIEDVQIGLRQFGSGYDVVFIHGFPTHGYTWRKIIPKISQTHKCHVVDLPGLGDSKWEKTSKFDSTSQAHYVIALIEHLKIQKCSLIAHDSGATVARIIAIERPDLVEKLVLINTEIPHHLPPWIPFYQKTGLLPLVPNIIRFALKQSWFIKSRMGFSEAYSDKTLLNNPENLGPYLNPLIQSQAKTIGAFKYLRGIDWKVIDQFKTTHQNIKADTLFIWGEDDRTFPVELGYKMIDQFNENCEFVRVANASLLPHEEKSEEVGQIITQFLKD